MTKFDFAEIPVSKRAHFPVQAPTMISQDDARQEPNGLPGALCSRISGLAGAIFADTLVFIYFVSFYASG